jgi:hypothetical protein
MSVEAINKITEFINSAGEEEFTKMSLDVSVVPHIIRYEDGEKFVAFDYAGQKFFIDPTYQFSFDYDYKSDPMIAAKVNKWGRVLLEKAKSESLAQWIKNMNI